MKTVFWTSVFWIAVVILLWAYIRLFNDELGGKVANFFYHESAIMQAAQNDDADTLIINDQLNKINSKLQNILETLSGQKDSFYLNR